LGGGAGAPHREVWVDSRISTYRNKNIRNM
jgi:hypothetical protein